MEDFLNYFYGKIIQMFFHTMLNVVFVEMIADPLFPTAGIRGDF